MDDETLDSLYILSFERCAVSICVGSLPGYHCVLHLMAFVREIRIRYHSARADLIFISFVTTMMEALSGHMGDEG